MKQNAADIIVMSAPYFILKTKVSTLGEDGRYKFTDPYKVPVQQINETFKARMLSDLASADDGIYTWIIKDDGKMYLSKTLSYQEIGSLHVNLFMFSESKKLLAAGELRKEGASVSFNLRSGTYMDKVIKTREIRNEKVALVSEYISQRGLTPVFLKCKGDENGNGTQDCTEEYETLAGMNIIDKLASIVTPASEIELYKTMFTVEGGAGPRSAKGGKRKTKARTTYKPKRRRSLRKRSRLT